MTRTLAISKTKEDLMRELDDCQNECAELRQQIKRFEKYEELKKMSDEIYMYLQAMMESGFTREEAMQIITACCPNGKRS